MGTRVHARALRAGAIVVMAVVISACATSRAFRRGEDAARAGDYDTAITHFTKAVQDYPDRADYKIALERAQQAASRAHFDKAKAFEAAGELDKAIYEYKKAAEYDPGNRQAAQKRTDLERMVRERAEANRPKAPVETMRERARRETEGPILNPASRVPLKFVVNDASPIDVLDLIGSTSGINVVYEPTYKTAMAQKPISLKVDGLTLEEVLNLVMTMTGSWYKVINQRTIFVMPDNPQMRGKYEDQVVRTFYLSHADATEVVQVVTQVSRLQTAGATAVIAIPNKTANTITVRGPAPVVAIIEKVIQANDRPRAEIVIDVEILEVSRIRLKTLGIDLGSYGIGAIFSPEGRPTTGTTGTTSTGPFNLNTVSQGISTTDFYLTVPQATLNFLASDSQTRLLAKPQLRGAEGDEITLNLGNRVPVPTTTFGAIGAGGLNTVPVSSFNYQDIGINVKMKARVTVENEILLEVEVENSTLGADLTVAGQSLPTFGSRKVHTRLRLREGEANLLAGLLREDNSHKLTGLPGLLRLPFLNNLTSKTEDNVQQTDIVMLLTPRIVRTHELTQENLSPIYIGSAASPGLTGPTPVIAAPPEEAAPAAGQPQPAPPGGVPPVAGQPVPPGAPPVAPIPVQPSTVTSTPGYPPSQVQPPTPQPTGAQPPGTPPTTPETTAPGTTPPSTTPPATGQAQAQATQPSSTPGNAPAQITVSTPGPEFRVGGGPYTVPISIAGASRVSVLSLTLTFNPATLRVRNVQEGTFMRQGGVTPTFTQRADPATGRVDISIARSGDPTGASGSGLLAAILFDAIAPGAAPFAISGVATAPDGSAVPLSFTPAAATVR